MGASTRACPVETRPSAVGTVGAAVASFSRINRVGKLVGGVVVGSFVDVVTMENEGTLVGDSASASSLDMVELQQGN